MLLKSKSNKLPQKIALFCTLPLNKEEYDADLNQQAPIGDYVKNIVCDYAKKEYLMNITKNIELKLNQLESFGVDVYRRATTSTLKQHLAEYEVVIILAHWKGHKIYASDVIFPNDLAFQLLYDTNEEIHFLRALVGFEKLEEIAENLEQKKNTELVGALLTTLNQLINEHDLVSDSEDVNISAQNRNYLEDIFKPCLCSGNGIELVDCLVSAQDFVEFVPDDYEGILDITTCYSVNLANILAWQRPNCIYISNESTLNPDFQLVRLLVTCELMSEEKIDFLTALSQACDIVNEVVEKIVNE